MSSKTKIFIMKKRELVYTAIFAFLGITFLILLILMFRTGNADVEETSAKAIYVPGVYSVPVTLNNNVMDLQVRVDKNHINSITLENLSESATAMFPLMQPALDRLEAQICENQNTRDIYYEAGSQYTSQMLLEAIDRALELAKK